MIFSDSLDFVFCINIILDNNLFKEEMKQNIFELLINSCKSFLSWKISFDR